MRHGPPAREAARSSGRGFAGRRTRRSRKTRPRRPRHRPRAPSPQDERGRRTGLQPRGPRSPRRSRTRRSRRAPRRGDSPDSRRRASRTASAGAAGRMYGTSFECDSGEENEDDGCPAREPQLREAFRAATLECRDPAEHARKEERPREEAGEEARARSSNRVRRARPRASRSAGSARESRKTARTRGAALSTATKYGDGHGETDRRRPGRKNLPESSSTRPEIAHHSSRAPPGRTMRSEALREHRERAAEAHESGRRARCFGPPRGRHEFVQGDERDRHREREHAVGQVACGRATPRAARRVSSESCFREEPCCCGARFPRWKRIPEILSWAPPICLAVTVPYFVAAKRRRRALAVFLDSRALPALRDARAFARRARVLLRARALRRLPRGRSSFRACSAGSQP